MKLISDQIRAERYDSICFFSFDIQHVYAGDIWRPILKCLAMEVDNMKYFFQSSVCSLIDCPQIYTKWLSEKEKEKETAQTWKSADFILHLHCLHHSLKLKICKHVTIRKKKAKV